MTKINEILSKLESGKTDNETINESSLFRLKNHITKHDCGTITAFRSFVFETDKPYELDQSLIDQYNKAQDDNDTDVINKLRTEYKVTRKQNLIRNMALKADLIKKYDVTVVQGKYVENYGTEFAQEVGETVFFVVDSQDKGTLKKDLQELGAKYFQDSVLFITKGGVSSELIGTSPINRQPELGDSWKLGKSVFGKSGEFMTKVKGRPFVFESDDINIITSGLNLNTLGTSRMGRWGNSVMSKQSWKNENPTFGVVDYREEFSDRFK